MTGREFPPARPPTKAPDKPSKKKSSRVPPHAFEPDSDVPPDFAGRRYCSGCKLAGYAGDDRHPLGALPAIERRYPDVPDEDVSARILGETTEGGNA